MQSYIEKSQFHGRGQVRSYLESLPLTHVLWFCPFRLCRNGEWLRMLRYQLRYHHETEGLCSEEVDKPIHAYCSQTFDHDPWRSALVTAMYCQHFVWNPCSPSMIGQLRKTLQPKLHENMLERVCPKHWKLAPYNQDRGAIRREQLAT